ncbi:MAG: pyruvate dehydrogenase (acetyl-transferring) E1 component subunit alpha [Candidatus Brocadiae bacterium]|nr:pyruvate dehydrogenase (acetyl-transferring) E1 component subunit alpha [Candidatus Brocadiia bacterium]
MTTEVLQVIRSDGSVQKKLEPTLSEEMLRKLYRTMVQVRALDEKGMLLQRTGKIGFYVPSGGQEASQVGAVAALDAGDWLFPTYRDPGMALWRGASFREMLAHEFGCAEDRSKGRQMPNHYAFREMKYVSISSPIATQIPQAVGAAMAAKYRKTKEIVLTSMGDGGTSEGDFHCGMNFAGVYKAPIVFYCQNNQWAISVPLSGQTASESISVKAKAYGFPGVTVDGNDVLAVYSAVRQAADRARAGGGPSFVEALTYRMGPHSSSDDPKRYRPAAEEEEWRQKDPIDRFRNYLKKQGIWTEAWEKETWDGVRADLNEATKQVEALGPPTISSMFDDVWSSIPPVLQEQKDSLIEYLKKGELKDLGGAFPL